MDQEATIQALQAKLARRKALTERHEAPHNFYTFPPGLQGLPGAPHFNPFGATPYTPGHYPAGHPHSSATSYVPWHSSYYTSSAPVPTTRDEDTSSPITPVLDDVSDVDAPMRPATADPDGSP